MSRWLKAWTKIADSRILFPVLLLLAKCLSQDQRHNLQALVLKCRSLVEKIITNFKMVIPEC